MESGIGIWKDTFLIFLLLNLLKNKKFIDFIRTSFIKTGRFSLVLTAFVGYMRFLTDWGFKLL